MKKQTHLHLGWPEGEDIFNKFSLNVFLRNIFVNPAPGLNHVVVCAGDSGFVISPRSARAPSITFLMGGSLISHLPPAEIHTGRFRV